MARWAGVQNVSRPMVRCHEISQITPTTALVDASTRALTCHGTVGARGGTLLATVTETPFQLDGSVRAVYGFVKPWCFKQKPRSWRRRTLPSQSTSLPTLRWPSSTACIASRSGSTPTSEPRPAVSSWKPPSPQTRSEEHTSELQSLRTISYAVFCLKKKKKH